MVNHLNPRPVVYDFCKHYFAHCNYHFPYRHFVWLIMFVRPFSIPRPCIISHPCSMGPPSLSLSLSLLPTWLLLLSWLRGHAAVGLLWGHLLWRRLRLLRGHAWSTKLVVARVARTELLVGRAIEPWTRRGLHHSRLRRHRLKDKQFAQITGYPELFT